MFTFAGSGNSDFEQHDSWFFFGCKGRNTPHRLSDNPLTIKY